MNTKSDQKLLTPKIIQDAGEEPLVLYSDVQAPLETLDFLTRALAFAELALISYNDSKEAQIASSAIGFSSAELLDKDGSQGLPF
jgi:triacylglycerol lipase